MGKNRDSHSPSRVATGPDAPSLAEVLQQEDLLVTTFESALRRSAPELIEEMQGIAQGSGLPEGLRGTSHRTDTSTSGARLSHRCDAPSGLRMEQLMEFLRTP